MKRSLPVWVLALPAFLFVIAAFIPMIRGRDMNVTFFALAAFWFIVALIIAKGQKTEGGGG